MRLLIVNADDFGESRAVNEAILRAHVEGIVTSASLMVTGEAAAEAVALARRHPRLRVGLHVTLALERPCLPPETVPRLVGPDGRLPRNATLAGLRWFLDPRARAQLRREVRAQVEAFRRTGLPLDHLNGHLHLHLHPVVWRELAAVARRTGAGLRLPWEPWRRTLPLDRRFLARKVGYILTFGLLARVYRPGLERAGILAPRAVFGLLQTGHLNEAYLLALLERLPPGLSELYAHPRLDTPAGRAELAALTSPRVRERLQALGIRLTTYGEVAAGRRNVSVCNKK